MYAVDLILKLLEQVERADKEGLLTPKYLNENISGLVHERYGDIFIDINGF